MAYGLVQQIAFDGFTTDPFDLGFTANTVVGDTMFCIISFRNAFFGVQTVTITDDGGNVWSQDARLQVQNDGTNYKYMELWSAPCTTALVAASNHKVHADFNFAPALGGMALLEYSGLASVSRLDQIASAVGNSTAPASGSTPATTAANELVLAAMTMTENGFNTASFSPAGYTQRAFAASYFGTVTWVGDKDSGASGTTHSMSGTIIGAEYWGAITAVYKLAGGGGGGPTAAEISPALLQTLTGTVIGRVDA